MMESSSSGEAIRMSEHAEEVMAGKRFEFGRNWSRFLTKLDDARIEDAERSLKAMLGVESLTGKTFLDIGSGSGLFSLAAARLGAHVRSFDFDPRSVACTRELKRRYLPNRHDWHIEEGSALDEHYVASLGKFDVVYSWGVLHHTGEMWRALENAASRVADGGKLFIAIYNDQGIRSHYWLRVKKIYNSGRLGSAAMTLVHIPALLGAPLVLRLLTRRLKGVETRGMTLWYDYLDWVGGLPFEVASPDRLRAFHAERGFTLVRERLTKRLGCNEFVFQKG